MTRPPDPIDDTLDLTVTRRLREVIAGAASTEAELRLLAEQGEALTRALDASVRTSESRLGALASDPGAELAEMASELRRVERLRAELADTEAALVAFEVRARTLRGKWLGQG
jgi:hypothetical protein